MDKFTLITGASTGIGKALAHISAENGRDLVLLARSQDKLETLGKALQEEHGVRVEIIVQDLAASNSAERTRSEVGVCWFSVKMTARLDVNATPGVRMSPLAPGIVPECSGASRVKRAARAGFAALDSPCALWYSLVVGERERSGAPGIRVFMRAPCYYAAHAAPLVPAPVSGPAPTRSLGPLPAMKSSGAM